MAQNSVWSPWTISDGLLTTLADQWLVGFETKNSPNKKESFVHADRLVKLGFSPAVAYGYVNDLRRRSYAKSIDESARSLRPYISPTQLGVNEIKIPISQEIEKLKQLEKKLKTKLTLPLQRLEILRQTFDKIDAFLL